MITVLTYISLICGAILIVLMLLSLVAGLDLDMDIGDTDVDVDTGGSLGLIKSLLTFASVSTWAMKLILEGDHGQLVAVVIGVISGAIAVALLSYIFRSLLRNDENVNWQVEDALFKEGKVYLRIPAKGNTGIVQVMINGVMRELKARTDSPEEIPTGATVLIKDIQEQTAVVELSST